MGIPFWRDAAIVVLAVELFIFAVLPLAVLFILNRLMWQARSSVRPIFPQVLGRVREAEWLTVGVSDVIVSRIIWVYALAARIRTTATHLLIKMRRDTLR
jgi:hypothetical protein